MERPKKRAAAAPSDRPERGLKFSELFLQGRSIVPKIKKRRKIRYEGEKVAFEPYEDDREYFASNLPAPSYRKTATIYFRKRHRSDHDEDHEQQQNWGDIDQPSSGAVALTDANRQDFHLFLLSGWEDKIIWDDEDQSATAAPPLKREYQYLDITSAPLRYSNFLDGPWENDIIWKDDDDEEEENFETIRKPRRPAPLVLDLNDDNLLLNPHVQAETAHHHPHHPGQRAMHEAPRRGPKKKLKEQEAEAEEPVADGTSTGPLDPFNLSNDKYYEMKKQRKSERVRHGVGKLILRHSLPALRLEYPYYKTFMSKAEARSFHRPKLEMPPNRVFSAIPPKIVKKDLQKLAKKTDIIQSIKDITLRDNIKFVLFEYSEEHPPIIMKAGMSTLVNNYYRKRNDTDTFTPQVEDGITMILESIDQSPFAQFGDVRPGETTPTITNNLFRAPIFKHQPQSSDFLIAKCKGKLYVREIPYIYVVGQTFPLFQVPHPNSRAAHQHDRNYVEVYAARQFKRKDNVKKRLPIREINRAFSTIPTAVVKIKMREVAEVTRKEGDHVTWWYLKPEAVFPSEEEIRRKVTPEMVCAYESMIASQQHLRDSGYKNKNLEKDDEEEDEGSMVDDELKLTPWRVSKNVISAFQGKALLQMSGFGDPTGKGEGYSFVRVPMRTFHPREPKESQPSPKASLLNLSGLEGDLRKLSTDGARDQLRKLGVSEDEVAGLSRWELISELRRLNGDAGGGELGKSSAKQKNTSSSAEQQRQAREDAARIWQNQKNSLSSTQYAPSDESDDESDFDLEKEYEAQLQADREAQLAKEKERLEFSRENSTLSDFLPSPSVESMEKTPDPTKKPSKLQDEDDKKRAKRLKIERLITKDDGNRVWTTEIVTDPRVIKMYLAERKVQEEKKKFASTPVEAEHVRKEKRRLEERLRKLKLVQEKIEMNKDGVITPGVSKKSKQNLGAQLRMKCGACGAVGHMKTNRMCPLFGKKPENEDLMYGDLKELKEEMKIDPTAGKIIISKKAFEKVLERKESFMAPKPKPATPVTPSQAKSQSPASTSPTPRSSRSLRKRKARKRKDSDGSVDIDGDDSEFDSGAEFDE